MRASLLDIVNREPDRLTDLDLVELPLSLLSKNLHSTLSHHSTIFIYLRWLEVHRREDTRVTKHWGNTVLHWCQALRTRGVPEYELLDEVDIWKRGRTFSGLSDRSPPTSHEISKAYKDHSNIPATAHNKEGSSPPKVDSSPNRSDNSFRKFDSMLSKPKDEDFQGPPPPGYRCNRCGRVGHYLQVCPTNMDPSFDRPPNKTYQCTVCGKYGDHYKSVCFLNKDPLSINQKRKRVTEVAPLKRDRESFEKSTHDYTPRKRRSSPDNTSRSALTPSKKFQLVENIDDISLNSDIDIFDDARDFKAPPLPKPALATRPKYSDFVERLIRSQGNVMTANVNHVRGRKSTLDAWEAIVPESQNSATSSPAPIESWELTQHRESHVKISSGRLTPYKDDEMDEDSRSEEEATPSVEGNALT
ncbi:hypothetical protein BJ878DRAFT_537463 [Calycina marina]|uniref:CCHC-type domain-containing protein n=1 Tax=Calycina marina TaxID=1763456 RepID=A0A9P8CJU1_9HELO|nr:hypothetical protein BJ878DRAFT_537463 [Calycina marina]